MGDFFDELEELREDNSGDFFDELEKLREQRGMFLSTYLGENHKARQLYSRAFFNTFKVPLERFWTPLFGFDPIKFDEEVLIPRHNYEDEKTSMADCIEREYGELALKMVRGLLGD